MLTQVIDWAFLRGLGAGGLSASIAALAAGASHPWGWRASAVVWVLMYLVGRRNGDRAQAELEKTLGVSR